MTFTSGDYIALCALGVSVVMQGGAAWRSRSAEAKRAAADETRLDQVVKTLTETVNRALQEIDTLEEKRQTHEINCARIQERVAAAQERTAEILDAHERAIGSLQGQMRHVATGSDNRIIEMRKGGE